MHELLVKIMIAAALVQLGISISEFKDCRSRECLQKIERRSRDILTVDWKPISVFPEEAERFR